MPLSGRVIRLPASLSGEVEVAVRYDAEPRPPSMLLCLDTYADGLWAHRRCDTKPRRAGEWWVIGKTAPRQRDADSGATLSQLR